MFTDKKDLATNMVQGLDNGTLIRHKHSVASLGTAESSYRSVVVPDTNDLKKLFNGWEDYTAKLYQNNDPKHNGDYVVITPIDTSYVSASGVPPMSAEPTHPCDVFVAVSGSTQGLHLFGEESKKIQAKELSGNIRFVKDLL